MQPICLPDPSEDYDNVKAVVTGWGKLKYGGSQPAIMREVTVRTQSTAECRAKQYEKDEITERMLCADARGRSTCQGDSGSPLVVALPGHSNYYRQVGVVNWAGEGCAEPGYPTVYARVTSFLPWIQQRMTPAVQGKSLIVIVSYKSAVSLLYATL